MVDEPKILAEVRRAALGKILFLPHALRQMSRPDRMISATEVRRVVEMGEVVEDYPEDLRGHSCLLLGRGRDNRPIHVVASPKSEYLAVITAYLPSVDEWENDLKTRKHL
jgi:hypothetical protein